MRLLLIGLLLLATSPVFAEERPPRPATHETLNRYTAMPNGQGSWTFWPSTHGMTSQETMTFQSFLPQSIPLPPVSFEPDPRLPYTGTPIEWPRSPLDTSYPPLGH
jgi:hypothetical protein